MSPSAPKQITWILGILLGIAGIIGHYTNVPFISEYNFPLLLAGFVILALGTSFRGL